jgi:hypothetical protein
MSDSLKATVIVRVFVFTISANGELDVADEEDEELELPRPPAAVDVPLPDVELDDELPDAFESEPPDTESPGSALEREAIVPLVGA